MMTKFLSDTDAAQPLAQGQTAESTLPFDAPHVAILPLRAWQKLDVAKIAGELHRTRDYRRRVEIWTRQLEWIGATKTLKGLDAAQVAAAISTYTSEVRVALQALANGQDEKP